MVEHLFPVDAFLKAVGDVFDISAVQKCAAEFGLVAKPELSAPDGLLGYDISKNGKSLGWFDVYGPGTGPCWVPTEVEQQLASAFQELGVEFPSK
jgi:hypothetical protein